MADWLTYKGQSPWVCIPVIKNTYDEGDKTTSVANPVWVVDQDGITDREKHDPCGYWPRLPYTAPPEEVIPMFEVYHEMLPAETSHVGLSAACDYLYGMETFISFDPLDYDGVVKFEFEVIAMNTTASPFKVVLVDDTYTICHEITIPANTEGTTGYELFRIREEFTPIVGATNYGLKFDMSDGAAEILSYPLEVVISNARIIVTQNEATKTRIQIPMFGSDYSYIAQGDTVDHISLPVGFGIFNQTGYTNVNDYTNKWPGTSGSWVSSDEVTNVWRYSSDEISTVSKVVMSVLARSPSSPLYTVKTIVLINYLPWIIHSYWGMYTAPTTTADTACSGATGISGTGWDIVWQDGCTGGIFTPVTDSFFEPEPHPWETTVYPDLSGISGSVDVFMGWQYDGNPWQHGTKWFTVTVNPGRMITDAVMTVVPGSTDLRKNVTLNYKISPNELNPLYVALFDIDTNSMVAGSEQEWILDEGWVRKDVEIPVGNLVSGHEYEFRVKCEEHYLVTNLVRPEIADVQLLINIDTIQHLTTWHRVFHRADTEHDNWYTPVAWGGDYWSYGTGANSIMHRSQLYLPTGAAVAFEQTAFTVYDNSVDAENYQYVALLDLSVDDATGSGENGIEVVGGKLTWTNADYNTRTRKRTGNLPVTHEQILGGKYGESEDGYIVPIEGFLVIKIK